jgi:CheY-like chemotaxis protein
MATILVVDDSPTNRQYLTVLLGEAGHRLLEAADGAEGLAVVRAQRPDLVIADILMPTMDGYEFVRRLRADPAIAATPVIFFTAHHHQREAHTLAARLISCRWPGAVACPRPAAGARGCGSAPGSRGPASGSGRARRLAHRARRR